MECNAIDAASEMLNILNIKFPQIQYSGTTIPIYPNFVNYFPKKIQLFIKKKLFPVFWKNQKRV